MISEFLDDLEPQEKIRVREPSMVVGLNGDYYVRSFRVGRGPRARTRGGACAAFMDARGFGFVLADGPNGPEIRISE